jgi:thiamine-monophosphate kinase
MLCLMPRVSPAASHSVSLPREAGELALIDYIRDRAAAGHYGSSAVRLGIGDDSAILAPPRGQEIVLTTDMSLEGRHFRRDWHPARAVGHRTLARGLSDLAAMGARPLAAFLSLALPRAATAEPAWLEEYLDGLLALASACRTPLAGGDTAESPSNHLCADVVLLGSTPVGKALRRSGAKPGDRLFVTGALGGSAAELILLSTPRPRTNHDARKNTTSVRRKTQTPAETHPHLYPQPRLAAGQALLRRGLATACIDISDGLSTDLAHLCEASGVTAEIEAAKLPLHPLAAELGEHAALDAALHGGEDYELLFTAPRGVLIPRTLGGVSVTEIGSVLTRRKSRPQIALIDANGHTAPLEPRGWEHLR